jgi:hypothetical protein
MYWPVTTHVHNSQAARIRVQSHARTYLQYASSSPGQEASPAPDQDWAPIQTHYDSGLLLDDRPLEDSLCLLQHPHPRARLPLCLAIYLNNRLSRLVPDDDDRAFESSPFRKDPTNLNDSTPDTIKTIRIRER